MPLWANNGYDTSLPVHVQLTLSSNFRYMEHEMCREGR